MHQVTATGGGGSQHTGSQQSAGAPHRLRKPKQPASAVVGAANESMATAMHPVINPRKVFICLSRVERWKFINVPHLCQSPQDVQPSELVQNEHASI